MQILLDTHIVYWNYYEPKRMPEMARQLIIDAEARFVSSASIWEIAIKSRLGKMNANPRRLVERIEAAGFQELPVLARHAVRVGDLPLYHSDPFDRILVAQAMSEPLHLLTADPQLRQYSELVIQV
jgi:PIN domain nuclease of toxin-antitoxin system